GRGGTVTVVTRRLAAAGHAAVEVAVRDEGPGFGAADRERLFEPYVRGEGAEGGDASAAGVGLGLAICRSLVASLGGTIVADEAPGGGARVAFTLPVAEERP
ncbi:MAG: ATP-binding protein, partial [Myxococcota bacterium]|nr:ATP-binding protein [Myxococcota bacterium]